MSKFELESALEALGNARRREIYERLLIQPRRLSALDAGPIGRQTLLHHVKVLQAAGLLESKAGLWVARAEPLGLLRAYFDRLWFEATVGEARLLEHFAESRRMHWRGAVIGGTDPEGDLDAA